MNTGTFLLGAIADDYTGGSDMAGMLAASGVRTVQTFGIPDRSLLKTASNAEAVIVSLKSRSIAAADAVTQSLEALERLRSLEPRQIQFKYCSTFDSTSQGNIGPVTSALMDALQTDFTIAVPALPVNGRTQYHGYLFVNGVLLSESHMRHHPLNPMTEPNLVRHLGAQTTRRIGLIDLHTLRGGRCERPSDIEVALVDAIDDRDLELIANGYANRLPLITGGSGISKALPSMWRACAGWEARPWTARESAAESARTLLLAGSCSAATLAQIEAWRNSGGAAEAMRVEALNDGNEIDRLADFCLKHQAALIFSSAPAGERRGAPAEIERAFSELALRLRKHYDRLIVAGGETSGAVVECLGIRAVEIGPEIDPGVPSLRPLGGEPLRLALKSGNFGSIDFFARACRALA